MLPLLQRNRIYRIAFSGTEGHRMVSNGTEWRCISTSEPQMPILALNGAPKQASRSQHKTTLCWALIGTAF